jgi:hypothetical protein
MITKELIEKGNLFYNNLITADCRKQMGGLGGCKNYDINDYPTDQQFYIQEYIENRMCSVEAGYRYMRSIEDAQEN